MTACLDVEFWEENLAEQFFVVKHHLADRQMVMINSYNLFPFLQDVAQSGIVV